MNQTTGQILRFAGLLLEMLGIWGVYNSYGKINQPSLPLPGGNMIPWPWAVWAVGFVFWLAGRIILFGSRTPRKHRRSDESHLASDRESG
jgi:hypothetical protein